MSESGWVALALAPVGGHDAFTVWSPDGGHLLLFSGTRRGPGTATLMSVAGTPIRTYEHADNALWLNVDEFMLITRGAGPGDQSNQGRIGSVESDVLDAVDVPDGSVLGNGHGAAAFSIIDFETTDDCDFGCPVYHFHIWRGGTTSDLREGNPVAWSADGSLLFVLHNVRKLKPATGAPAADDFVGWLEILSLPDLRSVRKFRETKITDRMISLDPTGGYLLYETVGDRNGDDFGHILDVTTGEETEFLSFQRSFGWTAEQQVVVGPQLTDPVTRYDDYGQVVSMTPYHGTATILDVDGEPVDAWDDVGDRVVTAPDGLAVVLYDEAFTDSYPLVTVFVDGERNVLEPLPVDGYIADCLGVAVAPLGRALTVRCTLLRRDSSGGYELTALHAL